MGLSVDAPWSGLGPQEVAELLAHVKVDWWVCGGWAVDLWLGRSTRAHADFDVGCWRAELPQWMDAVPDWDCYAARDGALTRLGDGRIPERASVWMHRRAIRLGIFS